MTRPPNDAQCVGYRPTAQWLHQDCLRCARREGTIYRRAVNWIHNVVIYGEKCEFLIESKAK